jgi:hypothetical protein
MFVEFRETLMDAVGWEELVRYVAPAVWKKNCSVSGAKLDVEALATSHEAIDLRWAVKDVVVGNAGFVEEEVGRDIHHCVLRIAYLQEACSQ